MINKRQTEALRGQSSTNYLCSEVTDITFTNENNTKCQNIYDHEPI